MSRLEFSGEVVVVQFVSDAESDGIGAGPGTYVTILLDDPDTQVRHAHVVVREQELDGLIAGPVVMDEVAKFFEPAADDGWQADEEQVEAWMRLARQKGYLKSGGAQHG